MLLLYILWDDSQISRISGSNEQLQQELQYTLLKPDLAPCDFWLFPKLTGCRYETIEEMKEAVMTVIEILPQVDFHGAF